MLSFSKAKLNNEKDPSSDSEDSVEDPATQDKLPELRNIVG